MMVFHSAVPSSGNEAKQAKNEQEETKMYTVIK
jgi:hypothetical protein